MRKIFFPGVLSLCFVLVFCPCVLNAEDSQPDYTSYLSSINSSVFNIDGWCNYIFNEIWSQKDLIGSQILPIIGSLFNEQTMYLPHLKFMYDQDFSYYQSFNDEVKPAILDIKDSSANIQQYNHQINENLISLYYICSPFFSVALENFYNRVSFDSDSLKVTDIQLRNTVSNSNQKLDQVNGGLSEILLQLTGIYNMIHNLVDPVTQISNIQDILQQILDIGANGGSDGDSSTNVTKVLEEWGYKDFGEDYKKSKDNFSSVGEGLDFTIVGYDDNVAQIETNMHTRSFERSVSKDNWFRQVQDFLLIIAKASQSQAMSGQLNYLINYKNLTDRKDTEKEKQEYEDRISELEQQVGELNQSFSDLEDLITYFSQPSEKKEVFTKFQTELQNIRLISNELPGYIKLGEFPASWGKISVGGDLSINIQELHPFFRASNSIFGFIYYSLITLFLIWLFSKVPLIIKPLLSLVKNIMTWK